MYGTVGLLRDRRELLRHCHPKDNDAHLMKTMKPLQKPLASSPGLPLPPKIVQTQKTPKE
eukprot:scaffold24980_cov117-Cylindrotheca_fusiformis.AAC.2